MVSAHNEFTTAAMVNIERGFTFTAPTTGNYSFGIDILASAALNSINTEANAALPLAQQPLAFVYLDMTFINNTQLKGFNEFAEGSVSVIDSPNVNINQSLLITDTTTGVGDSLSFNQGDVIDFFVTAQATTRSYSSEPIPTVPVPAALWFFVPALLMLKSFVRPNK